MHCGEGEQRIQWLAHVGVARYDTNFGLELGVPRGVQSDDGKVFDPNAIIKDHIADNQHVWVLIKGLFSVDCSICFLFSIFSLL